MQQVRRTLILIVGVAGLCGGVQPAASAPPNVVMIISDDQAWTDFGFMGHPAIKTPHLAPPFRISTKGTRPGRPGKPWPFSPAPPP